MASLGTPSASQDFERLHSGDDRWELVLRILASSGFRKAPRLREFLVFVCDRYLSNDIEELSEQHIGIEVFKRPIGYSTTEDNVVRAQARQVRIKLAEYFSGPGKEELLLLEIPKGTYVPAFSRQSLDVVAAAGPAADTAAPNESTGGVAIVPPRFRWRESITLLVAALSLIGCLALLWDDFTVRAQSGPRVSVPLLPPFSWIFDGPQPVTLVVADSGFGLYQDLIGRAASLDEYLDPQFFTKVTPHSKDKDLRAFSQRLTTRQFSSYADLALAQHLQHLAASHGKNVEVRFARDLHLRELRSGNWVFIGSPYTNPWVSLFAKRRAFPTSFDAQSRFGVVVNDRPRSGEPARFILKGEDGRPGPTFGVLAFLPADADSGNVLLLDGLNMEGTEAAGGFLTEARASHLLLDKLGLEAASEKRYLEVVVESKVMAGTTRDSTVAAYRVDASRK